MTTDYLLIGQGLAGTLLAYELLQRGEEVVVIDEVYPRAASKVAAGLINPITGRYFTKSWRVDELLPVARETYHALEKLLQTQFYHDRTLWRAITTRAEENDWMGRSALPEYQPYIDAQLYDNPWQGIIQPAIGYGKVKQAAQVDVAVLIQAFQDYLQQSGRFVFEKFDSSALTVNNDGVKYKDITAAKVVFCEGFQLKQNPWFNHLPMRGDKGEVLIIRIPGVHQLDIVKQHIFLAPLGEDRYWVGASYVHAFENDLPTEKGSEYLLQHLQEILLVPFEVLEHKAAVRPTVKDRRPMLGQHPEHPALYVFNGLGTKGASLGPFFARQMADLVTKDLAVDPLVDIRRFGGG